MPGILVSWIEATPSTQRAIEILPHKLQPGEVVKIAAIAYLVGISDTTAAHVLEQLVQLGYMHPKHPHARRRRYVWSGKGGKR